MRQKPDSATVLNLWDAVWAFACSSYAASLVKVLQRSWSDDSTRQHAGFRSW